MTIDDPNQVLIDGVARDPADAHIPVFDVGYQRGFGCFEALRSYGGIPFRADAHVDRLMSSAAALDLELPARDELLAWIRDVAGLRGDGVVRLYVSATAFDRPPRVVVFSEPIPAIPATLRLLPLPAPWHPAGRPSELAGAKTMSYAPNLAAMRRAVAAGFDDALLLDDAGRVLEGPTYSVAWVADGRVETPALGQGILGSITRTVVLEAAAAAGITVDEGSFALGRLLGADEAFVMSTVREVRPVVTVAETRFEPGAVTARLADGFRAIASAETS